MDNAQNNSDDNRETP